MRDDVIFVEERALAKMTAALNLSHLFCPLCGRVLPSLPVGTRLAGALGELAPHQLRALLATAPSVHQSKRSLPL